MTSPTPVRPGRPELNLGAEAEPISHWFSAIWRHRGVLLALAKKDFHVRYKRTTLGIIWSAVIPLVQSIVMVVIFSRVGQFGVGVHFNYAGYVLSGMVPWMYFSMSLLSATTGIVDGSSLTDKVWFPRAILILVPTLANLVTLALSVGFLFVALLVIGVPLEPRLLLLLPAAALTVVFTASLALVLGALYVYFRDTKFLVTASIMVWLYLTPIVYTPTSLRSLHTFLPYNPLTGIVQLFQYAAVGASYLTPRAMFVTCGCSLVLSVAAVSIHRRHDRLFVDLL